MAAFCQNHGAALFAIAPVAPHKAVGHVPPADTFHVLNVHQITNGPLLQQLLYL